MFAWIGRRRLLLTRIIVSLCVPIILLTHHRWSEGAAIDVALDDIGFVLVAFGVLGRIWAMLYIGGRKNSQLVTFGPYALCRNPLYLFTAFIVAGTLCVFENILLVPAVAVLLAITYAATIRREETLLTERFGIEYRAYIASVPMLIPRFRGWSSVLRAPHVAFDPRFVLRGIWQTGLLLLFVPAAELIEELHVHGVLPVLLRL